MILRAVAFLLPFALWVYCYVNWYQNPIRPESFSVLSFGMPVELPVPTVTTSSTPHDSHSVQPSTTVPYTNPFEVLLPVSIPTIPVKPKVAFDKFDVWKWEGLIGILWLQFRV